MARSKDKKRLADKLRRQRPEVKARAKVLRKLHNTPEKIARALALERVAYWAGGRVKQLAAGRRRYWAKHHPGLSVPPGRPDRIVKERWLKDHDDRLNAALGDLESNA